MGGPGVVDTSFNPHSLLFSGSCSPDKSSRAATSTFSRVNPNFICNSFKGAEAPNVFMPMAQPPDPGERAQPIVEPCPTDSRAEPSCGTTLARYARGCHPT